MVDLCLLQQRILENLSPGESFLGASIREEDFNKVMKLNRETMKGEIVKVSKRTPVIHILYICYIFMYEKGVYKVPLYELAPYFALTFCHPNCNKNLKLKYQVLFDTLNNFERGENNE